MHDIKSFENNVEEVKSNLSKRNFDLGPVEDVLLLNGKRKELIQFVASDGLIENEGNTVSEDILVIVLRLLLNC